MSAKAPVNVVLCWHMHQPQYQDPLSKRYALPWTYLHAIKDYIDMAAVIDEIPNARAVVNFTPILLEQLDEYAQQFDAYFADHLSFNDPLLNALSCQVISEDSQYRLDILRQCQRANEERLIKRFDPYRDLVYLAREAIERPHRARYLSDQFYFDLLVWYHLVWLGETVRNHNHDVRYLIDKSCNFSMHDRRLLLHVMQSLINEVVPSYRRLAERGKIELSFTPHTHPIMPLLLDFASARQARPDSPLPADRYPGGAERVHTHLARGIEIFQQHFKTRPRGCWPSEGAICDDTLTALAAQGVEWVASGGNVLHNSLRANAMNDSAIHKAYQLNDLPLHCYFRDDSLSDMIGFSFASWHADDAVNHLIHHIHNIHELCQHRSDTIVPIVLDGENCWETYPNNGYFFLTQLYRKLANDPQIRLCTFSEHREQFAQTTRLKHIVAGSWVYGDLATWIGDAAKNRGWELLCAAKRCYDLHINSPQLGSAQRKMAENQLAICEASDWFWWFGDYNPAAAVADFDRLFRQHLSALYRLLGQPVPVELEQVISVGKGNPENDGVMRRSQPV